MYLKLLQVLLFTSLTFSFSLMEGTNYFMDESYALILNMENEESLPRNFRMTDKTFLLEKGFFSSDLQPTLHGLPELRASASGQFSEKSLSKIRELIPASQIILIDLREESHGFINGIAISWYDEKNWGNKDRHLNEILMDENARLQKALEDKYISLYEKKAIPNNPQCIFVEEVYTEQELAKKMGIHYLRIPITDHLKPDDEDVDHFVEIIRRLVLDKTSSDYWIHMHCAAGRGRSTTFIAMYDMMLNAKNVSFNDILARQGMIGGKDLSIPFEIWDWRYPHHLERFDFLVEFYNYCLENTNFEKSWSSWKNK